MNGKICRRYISYTEGNLSREEYVEISRAYNEQIQSAEQKITDIEEKQATESMKMTDQQTIAKEVETHFFLEEYDGEKLNQVIDAIYVSHDGKIEVLFKRDDILREVGVA